MNDTVRFALVGCGALAEVLADERCNRKGDRL